MDFANGDPDAGLRREAARIKGYVVRELGKTHQTLVLERRDFPALFAEIRRDARPSPVRVLEEVFENSLSCGILCDADRLPSALCIYRNAPRT